MDSEIIIRAARESDLESLANLEQEVWGPLGTPVLTYSEIRLWYEEESPFFIVAESDGKLCGYYFGQRITFGLSDIGYFLNPKYATGKGFSIHAHEPTGRSMYGVNVISTLRGAGRALTAEIHRLLNEHRIEYFVGFSRLSRLDAYMREVEMVFAGTLPASSDAIALWYALETARLLTMKRRWEGYTESPLNMQGLRLPELKTPDPVLAFHVRGTTLGLAGILPEYMPDPASRNYGAFLVSRSPHT